MDANEEASAVQNAAQMSSQQQQQQRQKEMQQQKEAMEERRRVAVRSMMEPEALERLNRIGLVKPEKQRAVESLIIQSAQSGRLQQRIGICWGLNPGLLMDRPRDLLVGLSLLFR
ncbi:hypothetical protein FOZ60_007300 [Perkinsus olseni]|uniref:Programmed cell death protein 5 n=1 Tax=Perkinsus olseni TaxID=32597 RepID=A0A7J6NLP3_PEROL|nr:hypothetical protein FOZ60_007300 [Perkinsus olseni]